MTDSRPVSPTLATTTVVLVFLVSLLAGLGVVRYQSDQQVRQRQLAAIDMARFHINSLQVQLERNLSSAYALAALIRQGQGEIRDFEQVAGQLLPFYPSVRALALSPGGIVTQTYPLAGNEGSIGLNQFTHPAQRAEALLARDARRLTLTGPVELAQGGTGLIGRLPVFLGEDEGRFWGFVSVVIMLSELLEQAELGSPELRGYRVQLWRTLPEDTGGGRQLIAGIDGERLEDAITEPLTLPNGTWYLSLSPPAGWRDTGALAGQLLLAVLFSGLLTFLAALLVRTRRQARELERQVRARTAEISDARNRLAATLAALPDRLFELDEAGHCLPGGQQGEPEPQAAGAIRRALAEAGRQGHSRGHQYVVHQDGREYWFEISLSRRQGSEPGFVLLSRDISERKRAEQEVQSLAQRYHSLIAASNTGAWEYDSRTGELLCSDEYFSMLGRDRADYRRRRGNNLAGIWSELLHPQDREQAERNFTDYLARDEDTLYENQFRMRHADGSWVWILSRGRTLRDAEGRASSLTVGTHIDISQQIRDREQIHFLAHYDPLTNLPNRSLLMDRTRQAIQLARREQGQLALLFLDLDRFKSINDSLGHKVGDKLLIQVAERLRRLCRQQDTLSRFGGDEFILVLPQTTPPGVAHFAQRLLAEMAEPYHIKGHDIRVSVSLGIALYPEDGRQFSELYQHADIAMYQAKAAGRNSYRFFTAEMQERYSRMLALENGLRQAVARDQLSLVYQPQYSLAEQRLIGFEALLRWQHPELGPVSPAEFIPIAEQSGVIVPLGEWVLARALEQQAEWHRQGLPPVPVGVNVSAVQFRHPGWCERLADLLGKAGLAAGGLELELTESVIMDNPQQAIAVMDSLVRLGVRLALDDFGTGYSSLSYLKRFRLSRLKIDQSFVRDLLRDEEDRTIVRTIISLARNLGLDTVAEGVETREQLELLQRLGCDQAQGYYLGRPLPAEQATALLRQAG